MLPLSFITMPSSSNDGLPALVASPQKAPRNSPSTLHLFLLPLLSFKHAQFCPRASSSSAPSRIAATKPSNILSLPRLPSPIPPVLAAFLTPLASCPAQFQKKRAAYVIPSSSTAGDKDPLIPDDRRRPSRARGVKVVMNRSSSLPASPPIACSGTLGSPRLPPRSFGATYAATSLLTVGPTRQDCCHNVINRPSVPLHYSASEPVLICKK